MSSTIREWTCQFCGYIKVAKYQPQCCKEKMMHTDWVDEDEHIRNNLGTGQIELGDY